jgi:glycosyltransferase 2 family protein
LISGKPYRKRLIKIAGYLSPFLLTIPFLYIAFRNINLAEAFKLIFRSSIPAIFLYLSVFFASHLARAVRWKYMLNPIKKDVSLFNAFSAVMLAYGISCIIPRLGEIYRGLFLGKWEGISRSTAVGTIVVERIIDMAMFIIAALICVGIYSGDMLNEIVWLKSSLMIGFGVIAAASLLLILFVYKKEKLVDGLVKITARINWKLSERLRKIFDTLISGFATLKGTKNISAIIIWSGIILVLYALNAQVGFYILGMEETGKINFSLAWILMTISSFGIVIPTPGGTGPYHMISIFVLTQMYHFNYESSAAYSIVTHFISYIAFIISSIILVYIVNLRRLRKGLPKETVFSVFKTKETII